MFRVGRGQEMKFRFHALRLEALWPLSSKALKQMSNYICLILSTSSNLLLVPCKNQLSLQWNAKGSEGFFHIWYHFYRHQRFFNCQLVKKHCSKSSFQGQNYLSIRTGQPRSQWWLKGLVSWAFVLVLCLQYWYWRSDYFHVQLCIYLRERTGHLSF